MNAQIDWQFQLGDAPQILFQNGCLNFELMLVAGVLIMASAAALKIWARRRYTIRRRLKNLLSTRSSKAGLLFKQGSLNLLRGQNKRSEHGFARPMFVGRQAGQAIATIDKFFDDQAQVKILSDQERERVS